MGIKDNGSIKAVGAFCGGVAASGSTCGILLGGIAMISSIYSRANLEEKEKPLMWAASKRFMNEFEKLTESFESMNCRDIAQVDWSNRDEVRDFYKNPDSNRKKCIRLVGDAAFALGELLEQLDRGR